MNRVLLGKAEDTMKQAHCWDVRYCRATSGNNGFSMPQSNFMISQAFQVLAK